MNTGAETVAESPRAGTGDASGGKQSEIGISSPPEEERAKRRHVPNRNASDDEILGIDAGETSGSAANQKDLDQDDKTETSTRPSDQSERTHDKEGLDAVLTANPELKRAWEDARAYRESFRTPEEARTATAALADLTKMDALFFSAQPKDHAELAKVVASLDPAAFRSLAKAMTEVANQEQSASGEARSVRAENPAAPDANRASAPERQNGLSTAQEQFLQSANATAVQAVIESIESQVERLLPEDISKGARNRLVGEIYRELDTSLRADRQFSSQAREALRSGKLDEEHQRAIVSMVNNRAKQALPAVARRVLNEWTVRGEQEMTEGADDAKGHQLLTNERRRHSEFVAGPSYEAPQSVNRPPGVCQLSARFPALRWLYKQLQQSHQAALLNYRNRQLTDFHPRPRRTSQRTARSKVSAGLPWSAAPRSTNSKVQGRNKPNGTNAECAIRCAAIGKGAGQTSAAVRAGRHPADDDSAAWRRREGQLAKHAAAGADPPGRQSRSRQYGWG